MRIVAAQVRVHEMVRDNLRFVRIRAGRGKDGGAEFAKDRVADEPIRAHVHTHGRSRIFAPFHCATMPDRTGMKRSPCPCAFAIW